MNRLGGGHRKVEARTGLPLEKWSSVNGGIFCSLAEAKTVIESWRQHHQYQAPALLAWRQAGHAHATH